MFIVYADRHRLHPTSRQIPGYGRNYPETPDRVEVIRFALEAAKFGPCTSPRDFGLAPIEAVHAPHLLDHLRTAFDSSRDETEPEEPYIPDTFAVRARRPNAARYPAAPGAVAFDVSCPIFRGTWEASYWASQAALTAAEHLRTTGEPAYALVRPPGHHAGPDFHGGFCYTNHAAAAARYLQRSTGRRVAILDIDYHHGNGTQEIFYADPTVFFGSLHADPETDYPFYWGFADERGEAEAEGTNLNIPLPPATDDTLYLEALERAVSAIDRFDPGFLVLCAGFDLMEGDPVPRNGGFRITAQGLKRIGERIAGLGRPTVIIQEGGYNLERLGEYAVTLLRTFPSP